MEAEDKSHTNSQPAVLDEGGNQPFQGDFQQYLIQALNESLIKKSK
jgi:hypothetical protein